MESFDIFLDTQLNPAQKNAVTHQSGSILVIAGAGSGKTRVITARIAHLMIKQHATAESIVALTFTNKAANEMKERILSFLPPTSTIPFIGTFHAYCVQILKKYSAHLPFPFATILDSDDQQKLISAILQRNNLQKQFTAKSIAHHISQTKQSLDAKHSLSAFSPHPMLAQICAAYETEKRSNQSLDFDDLLLETFRLFKNNPAIKLTFQRTIRHILVDEYQDTNTIQHELLKMIALSDNSLAIDSMCAVGDEDQSIYSWRGATIANMTHFKQAFKDTQIITIDQNYRSVQPILQLANHAIENNTQRTPKNLWSEKVGDKNPIQKMVCASEYQEAHAIAQTLLIAKEKYGLANIGILYRTHTQSRAIEEALLKESIPYKIIGGIQFYERKEIKDLIAYVKIIVNPFDKVSFFRIINTPTRGLGEKFEEELYTSWINQPFSTWHSILETYIATHKLNKVKTSSLEHFMSIMSGLNPTSPLTESFEHIIKHTQYIEYINNNNSAEDAATRRENIKEFLEAITYFQNNGITTLHEFLDEVALMQDQMNKQNRNQHAVSLMTLHAAKGLEFSLVILPGLEEGIIPTTRSLNLHSSLEEERRLFYVGITRAKERLLITYAKNRFSYGQMITQLPSRFIQEIEHLTPAVNICYATIQEVRSAIQEWFLKGQTISMPHAKKISDSQTKTLTTHQTEKTWRKHQPVRHEKFGIGTIETIEIKTPDTIYLTVRFKVGTKKILAQFLQGL